ncbi:O-antigen ligase family protein [Candidatus Roizmanbacteria bacterium]|nr:O-antigen ligase family protein [Candidatus Roizmanbacteria bacterium]
MPAFISFLLLLLFLPTQLGKHFFLPFSFISGVRVDYLAPAIYLTDIFALATIIFNIKLLKSLITPKTILIFALFAIPTLFAFSPLLAGYKLLKIAEIILVFWIAYKSKLAPHFVLGAIFAGSVFEAVLACLQFVYKGSLQGIFYWFGERYLTLSTPDIAKASFNSIEILRPYATFSHPNSMAGFYLLIYIFILIYKPFLKFPILRAATLFFCSVLIVLSCSKTAILCYIFFTIIYVIKTKLYEHCTFCFISRILTISILGGIFLFAQGDPTSLAKRLYLIQNAGTLIVSHPFFGVGPGNYLVAQSVFSMPYLFFFSQPVHNIYLLYFAEMGVLVGGIALFLIFKNNRARLKSFELAMILGVIGVTGMVDHYWLTLQQNMLLAPIVFGVVLQRYGALKRDKE